MLWRPQGVDEHDAARWDVHPERSTHFLEVIANEKREGRFIVGNPTNAHYSLLIKSFWEKFQVYHTKGQFKNHFMAKKQLWSTLCWVQKCTGIQWDHDRKRVIASPEWWDANKDRKGLSALRDKSVPDYDLLELVYRGQHADGSHMCDPRLPHWPRPEGCGDSEHVEDVEIRDQAVNTVIPDRATPSQPTRKRKNTRSTQGGDESSPVVEQMNEIMGSFFERIDSLRSRRDNPVVSPQSPASVTNTRHEAPAFGSYADVMRVLLEEMKLDLTSALFYDAQELFLEKPVVWEAFLRLTPEQKWPWLLNTLQRRKPKMSTPTKSNCQTSDHAFSSPPRDSAA